MSSCRRKTDNKGEGKALGSSQMLNAECKYKGRDTAEKSAFASITILTE
jgi:hypothetical protein